MNNLILECKNLSKNFLDGNNQIQILSDINLEVAKGQQLAIIGRSGSGKTTLLQLLAGLDYAEYGTVKLAGIDLKIATETVAANLRNKQIGFIYQAHHLISELTALENVCLPLLINKKSLNYAKELSASLLAQVGLDHRANFYPAQLSGGEKQRVAIARAVINQPACIFADEPTGNLDLENVSIVIKVMQDLCKTYQTAIIMVTHDYNLANKFDQIYTLENGKLTLNLST